MIGMVKPTKGVKPRLRGWSHQWAAFLAVPAVALLVRSAPQGRATWAAAVYGASLFTLFAVSALYHWPHWPQGPRLWLRRLAHSSIFFTSAGSYTPFCLLLPPPSRLLLLGIAWGGALLGMIQVSFFVGTPRSIRIGLYLALGWAAAPFAPELYAAVGPGPFVLLAAGGFFYSAGALIY